MDHESAVPALSFSHLGIFVHDLPLMVDFYHRVLGFPITDRGVLETPGGTVELVFFSRTPGEHHQIVLVTGRPGQPGFNVVNQISFRVPDLAALRHFYGALQNESATELAPVTHGNAISLYFRDPEGNRIELFFDTPWYCEQPLREPVDLAQDDESILAETERLVRSRPGFKSREQWAKEFAATLGKARDA